jgi:starvation-inducible DNA-binding protein
MSNKPVTEALKRVLADTYTLYLKTQNYHWNVEGRHFHSLHLMFEGQYNELALANDEIAERIRSLGEKAPGTFAEFAKLSSIKEASSELDENQMVKDLYQSNVALTQTIKKALSAAQKADDEGTTDLLVVRSKAHEKAAWMLKSSLPADVKAKLKLA